MYTKIDFTGNNCLLLTNLSLVRCQTRPNSYKLCGSSQDKQISSLILTLLDHNTADLSLKGSVKDDVNIFKCFGSVLQFVEPRVIILDRGVLIWIVVKPEMPLQNQTQTVGEELKVCCQRDAQSLVERLRGEYLAVIGKLL